MLRGSLSVFLVLGALVVACSAAPAKAERLCTPNANVFCRCVDRAEGTKRCDEDGQSFQECLPCDGTGKGPGSGGEDGLGSGHGTDAANRDRGDGDKTKVTDDGKADKPTTLDAGPHDTTGADPQPTTPPASSTKKDAGPASTTAPDDTINFPDTIHCKPLKNVAPRIELQQLADEPTAAIGGKPAPGLYVQSWVIEFTGEEGQTGPSKHYSRETLEIAEDVGRYVFEDDDGTKASGGFRLTGKGTKVEIAYECPAAPPKELAYDATDSSLILYDPPYARVFIRQKESK
jgi:hypothetical protein